MDRLRRGDQGDAHALRRLRQFPRREVAAALPAIAVATAAPLRPEFTAASPTPRLASIVPPLVAAATVIAFAALAGSFLVTGLR
jgi:hypothetical protein